MKRLAIGLLSFFALCGGLCAIPLTPVNTSLVSNGLVRVDGARTRSVEFKPVPVEPGTCYHLSFEGRVSGGPTAENNPRVHVARFEACKLFWRWRIWQSAATNSRCSLFSSPPMTLFSSRWRRYDDLFRAEAWAGSVSVSFLPPELPTGLEVRDIQLVPYDNGQAVNLNGDFSLGEECLAGWNWPRSAAGFRMVGGRRVYDTGYGAECVPFPVDTATAYHAEVKRKTYRGYHACLVCFLDADNKQVKSTRVPEDGSLDFAPPTGAVKAFFRIYNSYLESAVVTPLGSKELLQGKEPPGARREQP